AGTGGPASGRAPGRRGLVPGPGPYHPELRAPDPRRVKKLRIYRSLDRQNGTRRVTRRQAGPAPAPPSSSTPASSPPLTGNEADKLSPDAAPSKSAPRP